MRNQSIYINLLNQFEAVFRHVRQGSYRTRHRYAEAFKRFLVYLAEVYRLERLANVAPKHLYSYVEHLSERGLSTAFIKTELSGIRFIHDQIPRAKHRLPSNQDLNHGRRQYGGVDRTWSGREFNLALSIAIRQGHEDYAAILCLGRYAALRLHECFRIDTQTASQAVKTGEITVQGKGGLVRTVPINQSIEIQLKKMLDITPRGHKLFVSPDIKTHLAMSRFESFLSYHKAEIQNPGSLRPLHFHGLRHTCAAEWYQGYIDEGMTAKAARRTVSKLLGHNRDDVTKIYLASLDDRKGGDHDGR